MAAALFQYCCTFGLFDHLRTDPGSEFLNNTVKHLNSTSGSTTKSPSSTAQRPTESNASMQRS